MTALHEVVPVDMVLHCPKCGLQHIDAPDQPLTVLEATLRANPLSMPAPTRWTNPPHRSHLCKSCGHIWRPADVPTNGVAAVATKGKADSPITAPVVPLTDELITKALRRAFSLGQTYWQQADSDSYKQNAKSDETRQKFETLIAETLNGITGGKP